MKLLIYPILFLFLITPLLSHAQLGSAQRQSDPVNGYSSPCANPPCFIPLVNLPGNFGNSGTLVGYLNALFMLAIAVAVIGGVLKITFAGIKYMLSGASWANQEEAKSEIFSVIIGLLIVLASVIILKFINPALLNLDILKSFRQSGAEYPVLALEKRGEEIDSAPMQLRV